MAILDKFRSRCYIHYHCIINIATLHYQCSQPSRYNALALAELLEIVRVGSFTLSPANLGYVFDYDLDCLTVFTPQTIVISKQLHAAV